MRLAISTDGEYVSAHFGRCPSFTIVDFENAKVVSRKELPNPGHEPGAIPKFLFENGVNYIAAGGMGMRAQSFFDEYRITPIVGVSGKIDEVIAKFAQGNLKSGESLCAPGAGKGYGVEKTLCDHPHTDKNKEE